jgi:hypothetical protein
MATTTNKTPNLIVDSTSHLPEILNVPSSSSSIIEPTTTNSNISNELIINENVC